MSYILEIVISSIIALSVVIITPSLVLPVVYAYARNYGSALVWMRRYFRHDMAFYSPFDLVYLYILNGQLDKVDAVYRKYEQKGNRGSEYFVRMWVAAHRGDWKAAETACLQMQKYTITSDVDPREMAAALHRRDVSAIDDAYLIDMNGRAVITPSLFRVTWVSLLGVAAIVGALLLVIWALERASALFA